jgi:hypothetical protein
MDRVVNVDRLVERDVTDAGVGTNTRLPILKQQAFSESNQVRSLDDSAVKLRRRSELFVSVNREPATGHIRVVYDICFGECSSDCLRHIADSD